MTTPELVVLPESAPTTPTRSEAWVRAARRANALAWVSLAWMSVEGVVGVIAGVQAHSLGVVTWAASSFVEALASLIVVWRFTGRRTLSATSKARAQRWVAASFFLLAPYFVIEAIRKRGFSLGKVRFRGASCPRYVPKTSPRLRACFRSP